MSLRPAVNTDVCIFFFFFHCFASLRWTDGVGFSPRPPPVGWIWEKWVRGGDLPQLWALEPTLFPWKPWSAPTRRGSSGAGKRRSWSCPWRASPRTERTRRTVWIWTRVSAQTCTTPLKCPDLRYVTAGQHKPTSPESKHGSMTQPTSGHVAISSAVSMWMLFSLNSVRDSARCCSAVTHKKVCCRSTWCTGLPRKSVMLLSGVWRKICFYKNSLKETIYIDNQSNYQNNVQQFRTKCKAD